MFFVSALTYFYDSTFVSLYHVLEHVVWCGVYRDGAPALRHVAGCGGAGTSAASQELPRQRTSPQRRDPTAPGLSARSHPRGQ